MVQYFGCLLTISKHKNDLLMSCKTNIGLLLLRLSTGGLMLFHGVAKLQGGLGFLQHACRQRPSRLPRLWRLDR